MKSIVRNDFKIFLRSIYLPIVYLLMIAFVNLGLIRLYMQLLQYASNAVPNYLRQSQQYGFLLFFILLFLAFEYMQRAKMSLILETLDGCRKGVVKMFGGKFIVLLSLVLLVFLNVFTYDLTFYLVSGLNFVPLLGNIVACDFLNYFFVGLIAILAGSLFALRLGRVGGYVCILLTGFLMLPISNFFFGALSQGSFNFYALKELIFIQAPGLQAYADALYGQPAEFFRWLLIFFWISLLCLGILRGLSRRKGVAIQVASILLAAFCVFSLSYLIRFTGIVRKGDIGSSYISDRFKSEDIKYYTFGWFEEKSADFAVTAYDLNLSVTDQLSAKAKITVDKKLTKYIFTLYHGYGVQSVTDESGNPLAYTQRGDYLDISTDGTLGSFIISYRGFSTYYYSNDQAVCLPGYFAYYPIPGHRKLFDQMAQDYLPVLDHAGKSFTVSLKAPMTLYTNLEPEGENSGAYSGIADALTIVGGLADKNVKDGIIQIYLPTEKGIRIYNREAVNREIQGLCTYLGIADNLQLSDHYTIISMPVAISLPNTVVFDDHLITGSVFTPRLIAAARVIGSSYSSPEKAELARILTEYVGDPIKFTTYYSYDPNDITGYVYGTDKATLSQIKLKLAVQKRGEDTAVKEVYRYLTDTEDTRDPEDFLDEISGWREEIAAYENSH